MWPWNRRLSRIESRLYCIEHKVDAIADALTTLLISPTDQARLLDAAHVLKNKTDALRAAIASVHLGR